MDSEKMEYKFKVEKLKDKSNTYNLIGNEGKCFCQVKIFPRLKKYKFRGNLLYKKYDDKNREEEFFRAFMKTKGFEIQI